MKRISITVFFALASWHCGSSASQTPPSAPAAADDDAADAADASLAQRFAAELNCNPDAIDPLRAWCAVTRLAAARFEPPTTPTVLFGISQPVRPGARIRDALLGGGVRVSTLAMDATHIVIRDIIPENADEKAQLLAVFSDVLDAINHRRPVKVTTALGAFADAQVAHTGDGLPFEQSGRAARFVAKVPTRAYLVDNVYVVIEPGPDGVWVSIYPMQRYQAM